MRRDAMIPFAVAGLLGLMVVWPVGRGEAGDRKVDPAQVYGRIQLVNAFPDYRVQVVQSFPDLNVQVVDAFPNGPGKWQIVTSFPDYRIQLVSAFPDFTVKMGSAFPGPAK